MKSKKKNEKEIVLLMKNGKAKAVTESKFKDIKPHKIEHILIPANFRKEYDYRYYTILNPSPYLYFDKAKIRYRIARVNTDVSYEVNSLYQIDENSMETTSVIELISLFNSFEKSSNLFNSLYNSSYSNFYSYETENSIAILAIDLVIEKDNTVIYSQSWSMEEDEEFYDASRLIEAFYDFYSSKKMYKAFIDSRILVINDDKRWKITRVKESKANPSYIYGFYSNITNNVIFLHRKDIDILKNVDGIGYHLNVFYKEGTEEISDYIHKYYYGDVSVDDYDDSIQESSNLTYYADSWFSLRHESRAVSVPLISIIDTIINIDLVSMYGKLILATCCEWDIDILDTNDYIVTLDIDISLKDRCMMTQKYGGCSKLIFASDLGLDLNLNHLMNFIKSKGEIKNVDRDFFIQKNIERVRSGKNII